MPQEKTPAEEIPEVQKEMPQPVEEKPVEEKKEKRWLKPLLLSILGIVLAAGLVFGGYKLGQKSVSPELAEIPTPTISPEATPSAGVYSIAGIDLTIDKALRVEREAANEDLLVLTVIFAANEECPLPGGAVCGYDTRSFKLVDEEGFVQDQLFTYPTIKYLTTNPISQRILKLDEKDRGDVFFEITKDKNKFFLTYSPAGETTEKIALELELFDPTKDWEVYSNVQYGYSIKYPTDFSFNDQSVENLHQIEVSGDDLKLIIRVKEEKKSPYYLDQESSGRIEVGGVEAKLYRFPLGYCDAGGCTQPFIAAVFYRGNRQYILEFYGESELTDTANLILSTFQFLD